MVDASTAVHLPIGLIFVLTATYKLCRSGNRNFGYRSIWLGMGSFGVSEVATAGAVYRWLDASLGPGWGIVLIHCCTMLGVGFAFNALHIMLGHGRERRVRNGVLTAGAVTAALAPWIISPPLTTPPALSAYQTYFDATWQSVVHWSAVNAYLLTRIVQFSVATWRRINERREEGALTTGIQLVLMAMLIALVAIADSMIFQVLWSVGYGPSLLPLFVSTSSGLRVVALVILAIGSGWPYFHRRWKRISVHRPWSRDRRDLSLLRDHWSLHVATIPEVSMFPEAISGTPNSAEELQWQKSRMVIEIYDARRRLGPYFDAADRHWAAETVRCADLPPSQRDAVLEDLCLHRALDHYRRGTKAQDVCAHEMTSARTADVMAARLAARLRLLRHPRAAAVITETAQKGMTWTATH